MAFVHSHALVPRWINAAINLTLMFYSSVLMYKLYVELTIRTKISNTVVRSRRAAFSRKFFGHTAPRGLRVLF